MESKFKSKLRELLKTKNLSETSIEFYLKNLERLNNNQPLKNLKFLENIDNIINKLIDKKDTTKRSYLISIVSVLNVSKKPVLLKKYQEKMYEQHNIVKKNNDGSKTETQKENWISWENVLEKHKTLKSIVDTFIKKKSITEEQYKILLDYLILSLYVCEIPPRRNKDYLEMYIVKNKSNATDSKKNYYCIDNNEMIFNNYKTSKSETQLIIEVGPCLKSAIFISIKFNPLKNNNEFPLLVDYEGNHLNKINSITRILNKIFNKKVGSSMLRHIASTHKYGDVIAEMKNDAKLSSHTIETKIDTYIKNVE